MKIAFLLAANVHGGPNRVVSEIARELALKGHEVTVAVPLVPHWTYHRLVTLKRRGLLFGVKHIARSLAKEAVFHRFRWVGADGGKVRVLRSFLTPDLRAIGEQDWYVLSNNWYQAYEWDSFAGKTERIIQMVYHHEETDDAEAKKLAQRAHALPFARLTLSEAASKDLKAHGVATDGWLFLGVDPSCFYPPKERPAAVEILMYWGLEPRKGAHVGLKAMEEIRRRFPEIPVRLQCQTERSPLPAGYEAVRSVSNEALGEVLRRQTIFVYPSLHEGFGLPPLEAMACGCAVVATKVGAIPEFSEHLKDAYLVDTGDASAIFEGVSRLIKDRALRERLSAEAARSAARYTWAKSAAWFEKFLSEREHV